MSIDPLDGCSVDGETVAWWHMSCGRVLGVYDGRLIEYEPSTLAPLGLVVGQDELKGKRVVVVGSGIEECKVATTGVSTEEGMEGADCVDSEAEEQAVLLVDDVTGVTTVVQPNEDGSYWRKIVRNKMIRMKEKRRMQAAEAFVAETFSEMAEMDGKVVSSWGPYTSIVGTAVKTGVAGLTAAAELTAKAKWEVMAPKVKADARVALGRDLQAAFAQIDTDGDGTITAAELGAAVRLVNPEATEGDVVDMLKVADADGNGEVKMAEFVMMMLFQEEPAAVAR